MLNKYAGFFRKSLEKRIEVVKSLYPGVNGAYTDPIDLKSADNMVENCIGGIFLPLGLGLNFLINSKDYAIPLSTEEPSIIAAASAAAKLIKNNGGFTSSFTAPILQGQIQVLNIDHTAFNSEFNNYKPFLIEKANTVYCPRMHNRGGGVTKLKFEKLTDESGYIDVYVNVGEAMGANIVNHVCEKLGEDIENIFRCRVGLKILTNYCSERRVKAFFKIPIEKLDYKGIGGERIARGFMESYEFASASIHRATTHNKGIMNGIHAAGIATGQDTRSLEAAAHSWASKDGRYKPLNSYRVDSGFLIGEIDIPIAVGTTGGPLKSNPAYRASLSILGNPSSAELSQILVCVGLACNFSAIRAMITEGISRGHMQLHAKNIATAAGVPSHLVGKAVDFMKKRANFSKQIAIEYLESINYDPGKFIKHPKI